MVVNSFIDKGLGEANSREGPGLSAGHSAGMHGQLEVKGEVTEDRWHGTL